MRTGQAGAAPQGKATVLAAAETASGPTGTHPPGAVTDIHAFRSIVSYGKPHTSYTTLQSRTKQ